MEKNSTEILREIEASLAEVKEKVRLLEEQLAQYQKLSEEEAAAPAAVEPLAEVDFTDMEIGEADDLPEMPYDTVASAVNLYAYLLAIGLAGIFDGICLNLAVL